VSVTHDPYRLIRDYWGEDLTPELVGRIIDAPEDHLDAFLDVLSRSEQTLAELPELARGHLRPVLTPTVDDMVKYVQSPFIQTNVAGLAPGVLLYAHEVVLDDISDLLGSPDRETRERAARWLLQVKPLFDEQALIFRAVSSGKRHPSFAPDPRVFGLASRTEEEVVWEVSPDHFEKLVRRLVSYGVDKPDARSFVASTLLQDAWVHVGHERIWGRRSHRLFRSRAEYELLKKYIGKTALDPRDVNLLTLASLTVPSFADHIPTIVSIRGQSDAFNEWRMHLASALDRLPAIEPNDTSSIRTARQRLQEELLPFTEKLKEETRRSAALSAIGTGVKDFGVALTSGLAGFAVGGNLTTVAASAVAGKAIDSIRSYKKTRKSQAMNQQLAELAMLLTEEPD
jgi:hypothetical protein